MPAGITRITIEGYKSIVKEQSIEIAPLTILAGANSSGKSSMIQPLLLLKQTLEAPFDPGPLLINGPILKFTSTDQFLSKRSGKRTLRISIKAGDEARWTLPLVRQRGQPLVITVPKPSFQFVERRKARSRPGYTILSYELGPHAVVGEIEKMIHVRGLRGNPERTYPITAVGERFPGIFEHYVASIVEHWQVKSAEETLGGLNNNLDHLDLNSGVVAVRINDAQLELRVKRTKGAQDLVNIADVGFGVSQAIPILVALRVAESGQLVYVEEPEQHLHPRAQTRIADVLADAAKRGVKVVVETHSSLLLRAVQTLIAKRQLDPDLVRLHWFTRDKSGVTHVRSAQMDENGAYGDWPGDFDEVILSTDRAYLDAVTRRIRRGA
jgi:predicted ATPase